MRLIIDIPDKDYEFIKDLQTLVIGSRWSGKTIQYNLINAIKNGVPYEERPQGKWIRQSESRTIFFCSNCGREINTSPFTRTDNFPFCHCGADMRGGNND